MTTIRQEQSWTHRLLDSVLTRNLKRVIFLSSLAAHIKNLNDPDRVTLERLNELLSLAKDPNTLRIPMALHVKIWNSFDLNELTTLDAPIKTLAEVPSSHLTMPQLRILAISLIRHMPKFLHYDSKKNMRQDIYKLVKNTQAPLR